MDSEVFLESVKSPSQTALRLLQCSYSGACRKDGLRSLWPHRPHSRCRADVSLSSPWLG